MNDVKDLVSIIIPVYKVRKYIDKCLQSLVRQSYKDIEIIFVDDAGNDGSIEIVQTLLQGVDIKWSIIKNTCNRGVSFCRNEGVKVAKGEFVFFIDSDDYISDTCIEQHVKSAYENQSDIVFGSFVYDKYGKIEPSHWTYKEAKLSDNPLHEHIAQNAYVMPWNKLIRRRFYLESGVSFKEGIRYEDEPWSFSLILRAKKISFLKEVTYYYRIWDGSFMNGSLYNQFRIDSQYCHLENCSAESYAFNLWENREFRTWYARTIFAFFQKVFNSDLSAQSRVCVLNKAFSSLRLPERELNEIALYSQAKCLSFFLPKYRWLKVLVDLKKIINYIRRKLN